MVWAKRCLIRLGGEMGAQDPAGLRGQLDVRVGGRVAATLRVLRLRSDIG